MGLALAARHNLAGDEVTDRLEASLPFCFLLISLGSDVLFNDEIHFIFSIYHRPVLKYSMLLAVAI
jgi:hypothetical protein